MPAPSTTRRDIASAYIASVTKIATWAAVSALVYRRLGPGDFAVLVLVRSTVGILNYTSLGLAPALVHRLARFAPAGGEPLAVAGVGAGDRRPPVLSYATPAGPTVASPARETYTTAVVATLLVFLAGAALVVVLAGGGNDLLRTPVSHRNVLPDLVLTMGFGVLARILSDPAGALLQTYGRIALDNALLAATDLLWLLLFGVAIYNGAAVDQAGATFLYANLFLLLTRYACSHRHLPLLARDRVRFDRRVAVSLLSFGLLLTLAQLADFLYAPAAYLLISHLLSTGALAAYAPCVQIDAALLLLVTGLSTALFPKAAIAHARNDAAALRRYYVRGTLFSAGLLLIASLATWLAAPLLLRLWLDDVPPGTLAILPLVLLHTTIGGSSAVGRSILLGAGRVKPFTAAVLLTGLANVALSYLLVRHTGLGLHGIVLGTVIAVSGRALVWTPWYTFRTIRETRNREAAESLTFP
jgi:O-antigen/teichoic acid export membrane protein